MPEMSRSSRRAVREDSTQLSGGACVLSGLMYLVLACVALATNAYFCLGVHTSGIADFHATSSTKATSLVVLILPGERGEPTSFLKS